ncbi:MAG: hypothetical protein FJ006_11325 [Chloroflexi bacterium]|nr:hypothetical protein [Chloroflexota bacterium]
MSTLESTAKQLLYRNLPLHLAIETEVSRTQYGQITFNVIIRDGVAQMNSLNIVKNKRIRYKAGIDKGDRE